MARSAVRSEETFSHEAEVVPVTLALPARLLAESLGTFVLVLTVVLNVIEGSPVWAVMSIAASLTVMVYALASASGAHFNPAVTLALMAANKFTVRSEVFGYMCAQVAGGCAGAFAGVVISGGEAFPLVPGGRFGLHQALIAEFVFTTLLAFVVLNVAATSATSGNQFYGLAIGCAVVAGGYACGGISGGCLNPAISLAVDCAFFCFGQRAEVFPHWPLSFAYAGVQLLGGIAAAFLHTLVRPEEYGKQSQLSSRLISECVGTFFLVTTVGLNVVTYSPAGALSAAAALTCLVYSLGTASGAHLNPAVTVSIFLVGGRQPHAEALWYVASQTVGGLAGALLSAFLSNRAFPLAPAPGVGWTAVLLSEVIFTALLCFTVLCVAVRSPEAADFIGLNVGFCIMAGGSAVAAISGGALNPALALGLDAAHGMLGGGSLGQGLVYGVAEMAGAALAAGVFYLTYPEEFQKRKGLFPDA